MIVIYRSWGAIGFLTMVLPVFLLVGFINQSQQTGYLASGCGFLLAGTISLLAGLRLNRVANLHTTYFIPLQYWGLLQGLCGVVILVLVGLKRF